jgi:hypothetical protein
MLTVPTAGVVEVPPAPPDDVEVPPAPPDDVEVPPAPPVPPDGGAPPEPAGLGGAKQVAGNSLIVRGQPSRTQSATSDFCAELNDKPERAGGIAPLATREPIVEQLALAVA